MYICLTRKRICVHVYIHTTYTHTYIYARLARLGCIRGRRLRIHHDECYLILCHCPPWAFCPVFLLVVLAFSRPLVVISRALVSVRSLLFLLEFYCGILLRNFIHFPWKFYLQIYFILFSMVYLFKQKLK